MIDSEGKRAAFNDQRSQRNGQVSATVHRAPEAIGGEGRDGLCSLPNIRITVPEYGPRNKINVDGEWPVTIDGVEPDYVADDRPSGKAIVDADGIWHLGWNYAAKDDPQLRDFALRIKAGWPFNFCVGRRRWRGDAISTKRGNLIQSFENTHVTARGTRGSVKVGARRHDKRRPRRRLLKVMHVRPLLLNGYLPNAGFHMNVHNQPFRRQSLDLRGK